jgi:hypothetical protein
MTLRPERWRIGSSGFGSLTLGKRPGYYRLGALAPAPVTGRWTRVAVSMGPRYGTFIPFRPPGAKGTRWCALLAWERRA